MIIDTCQKIYRPHRLNKYLALSFLPPPLLFDSMHKHYLDFTLTTTWEPL